MMWLTFHIKDLLKQRQTITIGARELRVMTLAWQALHRQVEFIVHQFSKGIFNGWNDTIKSSNTNLPWIILDQAGCWNTLGFLICWFNLQSGSAWLNTDFFCRERTKRGQKDIACVTAYNFQSIWNISITQLWPLSGIPWWFYCNLGNMWTNLVVFNRSNEVGRGNFRECM